MPLFYTISLICFLIAIASDLVKWLNLARIFTNISNNSPNSALQQELREARIKLQEQRSQAETGEYSRLVKIMRAEGRVKDIEEKIESSKIINRLKSASVDFIAGLCFKVLLSIVLAKICVSYRYEPVIIFSPQFNLKPFEGLLSFPTGIANAISVPVWIFACQSTFRLGAFLLKQ